MVVFSVRMCSHVLSNVSNRFNYRDVKPLPCCSNTKTLPRELINLSGVVVSFVSGLSNITSAVDRSY